MSETLPVRQQRLSECEAVIERAQRHVQEAGKALLEIRIEAYYVDAGYNNFEEYCIAKWNYSKVHASRLISSFQAIQIIESEEVNYVQNGATTELLPAGNKVEDIYSGNKDSDLSKIYSSPFTREERDAKPRQVYSEGVLRPLNKIVNNPSIEADKKKEIVKEVWNKSKEVAKSEGKENPTAEIVQKVAEEYCPEVAVEDAHPYRVVTYLNARYRKMLDLALRGEKEADYLRRMVEYCLKNKVNV